MADANYSVNSLSERDNFSIILAIHHLAYFAEQLGYSEPEHQSFRNSLALEAIQGLTQILLPLPFSDHEEHNEAGELA